MVNDYNKIATPENTDLKIYIHLNLHNNLAKE
jgi:hypothetical protein